jgi:hypothetical protein
MVCRGVAYIIGMRIALRCPRCWSKVMVMLENAPADFFTDPLANLSRRHIVGRSSARGAASSEHSYHPTWSSSSSRSLQHALWLLYCNLSSPRTPRLPRRTCGQMGCAWRFKRPEPSPERIRSSDPSSYILHPTSYILHAWTWVPWSRILRLLKYPRLSNFTESNNWFRTVLTRLWY